MPLPSCCSYTRMPERFGRDHAEREVKLIVAIAAQRVEDVSGEALRMDAHQRRSWASIGGRCLEIAKGERDGGLDGGTRLVARSRERPSEAENAEVAPAGGEKSASATLGDAGEWHNTIIDLALLLEGFIVMSF